MPSSSNHFSFSSSSFTAILSQRKVLEASRYGFNGKEKDDEVTGSDGTDYDYGMRMYDARLGRFMSVDPLTKKYPTLSPYQFASNSPISGVDLDGLEYFYAANGTLLGQLGTSTEVRVIDESKISQDGVKELVNLANNFGVDSKAAAPYLDKFSSDLGVTHDVFEAFAAVIDKESSGNAEESKAIGNVTMNFLKEGGSSDLKTLSDVTQYDNTFAQGATEKNLNEFSGKTETQKNSKFALGAAINALGFSKGIKGFSDVSNGADSWDGVDLIQSKKTNSHRDYIWSTDSKNMLKEFKKSNNGGVKVDKFIYSKSSYDIAAKKIIGKTLFTNLQGGRGEYKQSKVQFVKKDSK